MIDVSLFLFSVAGISFGLFVFVIAFFEDEPPTPPIPPLPFEEFSRSASIRSLTRSANMRRFVQRSDTERYRHQQTLLATSDGAVQPSDHYYIEQPRPSSAQSQSSSSPLLQQAGEFHGNVDSNTMDTVQSTASSVQEQRPTSGAATASVRFADAGTSDEPSVNEARRSMVEMWQLALEPLG